MSYSVAEATAKQGFNVRARPQKLKDYPLERRFIWRGAIAGVAVGAVSLSAVLGFCVFVLFAVAGILWRKENPPVLVFCMAYQWLFIVLGYAYNHFTGHFPALPFYGNLDFAVLLSVSGLFVLAVGMRVGLYPFFNKCPSFKDSKQAIGPRYNVKRLFWSVIALYSINWFIEITPAAIAFRVSQIITNLISFREVLLFLLIFVIVRRRRGYLYGIAALIYAMVPRFASVMSNFKELLFYIVIALLTDLHLHLKSKGERQYRRRIMTSLAIMCILLVGMALIWEGGVKPNWRPAVVSGDISGSPMEKVGSFAGIVQEAMQNLDLFSAFEALVTRMSSGIGYFSLVLDRVPEVVPHEGGMLTGRVFEHVAKPRFLFPEKPNLGSNSWLVSQYAGAVVAGEEEGTSVGLAYMAQFYIDFGFIGMFFCILVLGTFVGGVYGALFKFSPVPMIAMSSATVIFIQHFISFEGEIAYMIGGILQTFIIFILLIYFAGPWFMEFISRDPKVVSRDSVVLSMHQSKKPL